MKDNENKEKKANTFSEYFAIPIEYRTDENNRKIFWWFYFLSYAFLPMWYCALCYYYGYYKPAKEGKLDKEKLTAPNLALMIWGFYVSMLIFYAIFLS